jgi:hypothetical protein
MRELNQIKKPSSFIKKMFPAEMVRKLKLCDGKLSNLLQTFQVCRRTIVCFTGVTYGLQVALVIDARLEQIEANKSRRDRDQCEDQSGVLECGDSDPC